MRKTKTTQTYDEMYLLDEIRLAQNAMDSAYSNFEQATEPDLIDCYIYMINATTTKYKFLINRAKSLNLRGYQENISSISEQTSLNL